MLNSRDDQGAQRGEATAAPAESLLPIASVDVLATLDRLRGSELLTQGRVNIISLEAVAEKLGQRWPMRRELVHHHVERSLERQLAGHGYFEKLSDTDYLVVQPGVTSLAGQARCLKCLREILHHFLGAAPVGDIRVHTVTRISPEGIHGERIDVATVDEADVRQNEEQKPSTADQWSPFVTTDGQRVRVSCALEPVILLKTSSRIGYRVVRRVLRMPSDQPLTAAEQRNLSRADIARIDFATISRGLARLQTETGQSQCPSLILPVSYITLSTLQGRAVVVDLFRKAQEAVRLGVICEICDVEGVPAGALATAAGLIRPFCLYVVCRLDEIPGANLSGLKSARLQALSFECAPGLAGDAEFIGWAREALSASQPAFKSVMLHRLTSAHQMALAAVLGASHGSLRGAEPKAELLDP